MLNFWRTIIIGFSENRFFKKYQLIFDDERKIIKYYIEKENENENINTQKDN